MEMGRQLSLVADHGLPGGYKMRCAELMVLSDIPPDFPSSGMPTIQQLRHRLHANTKIAKCLMFIKIFLWSLRNEI